MKPRLINQKKFNFIIMKFNKILPIHLLFVYLNIHISGTVPKLF
jgi:hypothetical protein